MGTPRAGVVAFGLAAMLAIACGTSNVANDADVTITGSLANPDGSPAEGVTVGLVKEPGAVDALVELAATVSSMGLLCLTHTVSICKGARKTTTDDSGKYSFTMRGNESKTMLSNPSGFLVSSALPGGGPSVQVRFEVTQTAVEVPAATFWKPEALSVTADKTSIKHSWSPIKTVKGAKYALSITSGESVVWHQESGANGQLDARIAADHALALHAIATSTKDGSGTTFTTSHHSHKQAFQGAAGPAMSRGASCSVAGQHGQAAVAPCVFTDGGFAGKFPTQQCTSPSPASPSPPVCEANRWVALDLGSSRQVGALFLHGLQTSSEIVVESSVDGSQWTQRGKHRASTYARLTYGGFSARHVRVRADNTIWSLHEFSVWP